MNRDEFDRLSDAIGIPVLIAAVIFLSAIQLLMILGRRAPWQLKVAALTAVPAALAIVVARFIVLAT